ncbi:VOC family protein [Brevibacterium spongiae]|uniref:VOC family protein n=1 Tax=Brevibacterium spongiae TaxID=2909672 RepID=A0ABY5SW77_9MICO|nr:VOC family protein [Brevibacterium spongiae]UVI36949.1 VOC family protein [Brevibacterium spongiae]
MEATVAFYRALGLSPGDSSRPGNWVEMPAEAGMLGIHAAPAEDAGSCEIAFETDESLEDVSARMLSAGFEAGPVVDENYGQSLRLRDPDGVGVQINRYDRELYT